MHILHIGSTQLRLGFLFAAVVQQSTGSFF